MLSSDVYYVILAYSKHYRNWVRRITEVSWSHVRLV